MKNLNLRNKKTKVLKVKKVKREKIEWKNSFILRRFARIIGIVFIGIAIIITLSTYFVTKHVIKEVVKTDLVKQFTSANKNMFTEGQSKIKVLTNGILEKTERVYITKDNTLIYGVPVKNNNGDNLELVDVKGIAKENKIIVKLYVNLDKRIEKYFSVFYKFVIPTILIFGLIITLFSIILLRKLTEKLYSFVRNVRDFKEYGLEFNELITFETEDEAGVLSREFESLVIALRKMNQKQRQFVNDAAHELRVPLSVIEGNLHLLDKRGYDAEGKAAAKELVMSNIYTVKTLVDDMLDLTHEEIIIKEKLEDTNISEIVFEIIDDYKKIYTNYSFKTDIDVASFPIQQLDIVKLTNVLLENAIKYSTEDLKEIEVKIKQKSKKTLLIVTDYGIGMNEESVEKAFDLFWRADGSRSRDKGGVGVGLTLAKKICDKYNSKISITSGIGTGTTVTVELRG